MHLGLPGGRLKRRRRMGLRFCCSSRPLVPAITSGVGAGHTMKRPASAHGRTRVVTKLLKAAQAAMFPPTGCLSRSLQNEPRRSRMVLLSGFLRRLRGGDGVVMSQRLDNFSPPGSLKVAALFVASDGCYAGLPGVDVWDITRDARSYAGPYPVVAHPPCQRWGKFWHGSTRKPHQFKLGADEGKFAAALTAVRNWGGVLEHPADSQAWDYFGLMTPDRACGWVWADRFGGWTCYVEQGQYGHFANKGTWLYAAHVDLPSLNWVRGEQRLDPKALAKHGYEKARRIGQMAMIGGKNKTAIREATPPEFRDVLLSIARSRQTALEAAE